MAVRVTDPSDSTGYLTGISAVAAGDSFSLALKNDASVRGWGANGNGNLGDNSTTSRTVQVIVSGAGGTGQLSGVTSIAAGEMISMARKTDGTVWTWGANERGALGDNSDPAAHLSSVFPVQVMQTSPLAVLDNANQSATGFHGLVVKAD
ncbi:MAG: hypothetical protein ACYC9M_14265 [Desulfobulbaceae bacterium]